MSQIKLETAPVWAPNDIQTDAGWTDPDTGEVHVAIRGLPQRAGSGNVASVSFAAATLVQGGAFSVKVNFNEKVDVTAGANLSVSNTGSAGAKTLYAAAQTGVNIVTFNKQSDNTTAETVPSNVSASQTLTNDGVNITNNDTVTIDGVVYTFQDTLTNVAGHVLKGASNTASMTNLFHAINASGGTAGTDYAALCVAHPTVVATNPSGTTVVVTAKTKGTGGNALAVSEASSHLAWGGSGTLAGGITNAGTYSIGNQTISGTIVDTSGKVAATGTLTASGALLDSETVTIGGKVYTIQDTLTNSNGNVLKGSSKEQTLDNLAAAINLDPAGNGTVYAAAMTVHSTVTAVSPDATLVVTAKTKGTGGNSIGTTETCTNAAWGGSTLAGGAVTASTKTISAPIGTAAGTRPVAA